VALPRFPVSIPGVSVKYYAISGASEDALVSVMLTKGPKACAIADAVACFYPKFIWNYQSRIEPRTGVCSVTSVTLTVTYTISLPQWTGPSRVPAALAAWWKLVLDHVAWHESQHLAIAESYVPKLKQAILGGPCDQAGQDKVTSAVLARLEAAQNAFDVQQRSWTWPPYGG
jgi:predicted secreted Zn-dependent protease